MTTLRDIYRSTGILGVAGLAVLLEALTLRLATRTLIHIPGLERFELPIAAAAELGRFAYYVALVFVVAGLATSATRLLQPGEGAKFIAGAAVITFLVTAGLGRLSLISQTAPGWISAAILFVIVGATWDGRRSIPLLLFVSSSGTAALAVLGQDPGIGLTGGGVDLLMSLSELLLVLAALTIPLLSPRPPGRSSWLVGMFASGITLVALLGAPSTISILALWNLGVPGSMPAIILALAAGAVVATGADAAQHRDWHRLVGLILIWTGGVGVISTYQTALVIFGMIVINDAVDTSLFSETSMSNRRTPLGVSA